MKYIVSRTSEWYSMPCKDCIQEEVHEVLWDGNICKYTTKVWTKEIDDLINFVEEYGRIILTRSEYKEIPWEIEIYDDYRE